MSYRRLDPLTAASHASTMPIGAPAASGPFVLDRPLTYDNVQSRTEKSQGGESAYQDAQEEEEEESVPSHLSFRVQDIEDSVLVDFLGQQEECTISRAKELFFASDLTEDPLPPNRHNNLDVPATPSESLFPELTNDLTQAVQRLTYPVKQDGDDDDVQQSSYITQGQEHEQQGILVVPAEVLDNCSSSSSCEHEPVQKDCQLQQQQPVMGEQETFNSASVTKKETIIQTNRARGRSPPLCLVLLILIGAISRVRYENVFPVHQFKPWDTHSDDDEPLIPIGLDDAPDDSEISHLDDTRVFIFLPNVDSPKSVGLSADHPDLSNLDAMVPSSSSSRTVESLVLVMEQQDLPIQFVETVSANERPKASLAVPQVQSCRIFGSGALTLWSNTTFVPWSTIPVESMPSEIDVASRPTTFTSGENMSGVVVAASVPSCCNSGSNKNNVPVSYWFRWIRLNQDYFVVVLCTSLATILAVVSWRFLGFKLTGMISKELVLEPAAVQKSSRCCCCGCCANNLAVFENMLQFHKTFQPRRTGRASPSKKSHQLKNVSSSSSYPEKYNKLTVPELKQLLLGLDRTRTVVPKDLNSYSKSELAAKVYETYAEVLQSFTRPQLFQLLEAKNVRCKRACSKPELVRAALAYGF